MTRLDFVDPDTLADSDAQFLPTTGDVPPSDHLDAAFSTRSDCVAASRSTTIEQIVCCLAMAFPSSKWVHA
jgi:hypothetical protein